MSMDDDDGQMKYGDLGGLKLPDISLTGEENPEKNLSQDTYPVHRCGTSGSMRACHAAGPGSIPGRDKFTGWGFFGVFPHL